MTINRIGLWLGLALAAFASSGRAQTSAPSGPPPAAIKVANQTKQNVVAIYSSIPDRGDWGNDMLGKGKLGPGKTLSVKLIGPSGECVLDFSALLENGDTAVQKAVNVCVGSPVVQF